MRSKLVCGDFFNLESKQKKFLFSLKGKIDLALCDPPWGIANRGKVTKSHGKLWSTAQTWGEVFKDDYTSQEYDKFINDFLRYSFVLLKEGGSLVTFIDDKYAGILIRMAELINKEGHKKDKKQPLGFVHKKNIHCVKTNCVPKIRTTNYASAVEVAVWLVKPKISGPSKAKPNVFNYQKPQKDLRHPDGAHNIREFHNTCASNVFFYNIGGGQKLTNHPCEKHQSVLEFLIKTHSNEGDIVLDPFMGSGAHAIACRRLKRNFIGYEIESEWYSKACRLLSEFVANEKK